MPQREGGNYRYDLMGKKGRHNEEFGRKEGRITLQKSRGLQEKGGKPSTAKMTRGTQPGETASRVSRGGKEIIK